MIISQTKHDGTTIRVPKAFGWECLLQSMCRMMAEIEWEVEGLSCPRSEDLSESGVQSGWTRTWDEKLSKFESKAGEAVLVEIESDDWNEEIESTSVLDWLPSQAELVFVAGVFVGSPVGDVAIVWSDSLQYAHTCSAPTWWDWFEHETVWFHSLQYVLAVFDSRQVVGWLGCFVTEGKRSDSVMLNHSISVKSSTQDAKPALTPGEPQL